MRLNLIKFANVKSTNDIAIKIIKSKKRNAGIIVSDNQTKGRGTMGKQWISLNGNLFASIFFQLKKNMPKPEEFSLINPLIIKRVLNKYSRIDIKIKLPNDLLIKSRKVCGILQELIKIDKKNFLIICIGINTINSPNNKKFVPLIDGSLDKVITFKLLKGKLFEIAFAIIGTNGPITISFFSSKAWLKAIKPSLLLPKVS